MAAVGDVHLEADLVSGVFRNAPVGPPPAFIERILWYRERSSGSDRRLLRSSVAASTTIGLSPGELLIDDCDHVMAVSA